MNTSCRDVGVDREEEHKRDDSIFNDTEIMRDHSSYIHVVNYV